MKHLLFYDPEAQHHVFYTNQGASFFVKERVLSTKLLKNINWASN